MPGTDGITALREINKIYNPKEFPYIAFVTSKENLIYEALKEFPYTFIRKKILMGFLRIVSAIFMKKLILKNKNIR